MHHCLFAPPESFCKARFSLSIIKSFILEHQLLSQDPWIELCYPAVSLQHMALPPRTDQNCPWFPVSLWQSRCCRWFPAVTIGMQNWLHPRSLKESVEPQGWLHTTSFCLFHPDLKQENSVSVFLLSPFLAPGGIWALIAPLAAVSKGSFWRRC